jgi:hypothetical protein
MCNWRSLSRHAAAKTVALTLGRFAAQVKYSFDLQVVPAGAPAGTTKNAVELLELDGGAGGLEGRLCLVSVGLRDVLQDGLGGAVHEVLGFL